MKAVGRRRGRAPKGRFARLIVLLLLVVAGAIGVQGAMLWQQVSERMEGRAHDEPARITGLVPRLARGSVATQAGWRETLGLLGFDERPAGDSLGPGQFWMQPRRWRIRPPGSEPLNITLDGRRVHSVRRFADGQELAGWDFPLPAISLLTDGSRQRRSVVPLADVPLALRRAVVAIEDERFYQHGGIDPRGVLRAAVSNLRAGGISQGGSTITQQLAKNMFLSADRKLSRKIQEAAIALILERRYSKERILEAYLNEIYLGQRGGYAIMGVGEAASAWFGVDVAALSVAQSATLAGAIHAPNRAAAWKHPEEAERRRDVVLHKMIELRALPEADLQHAMTEPISARGGSNLRRTAPWFIDSVVQELSRDFTPEALHRDGLELVSTLDPRMQRSAEGAIKDSLSTLMVEHPRLFRGEAQPEALLLAMDPRSGAVRALVGGVDYGRSQFNRALSAKRQPGSAFKPVVLAAALEARWPRLKPSSLVDDSPLVISGAGARGADWSPRNHDGKYKGWISLRRATEESRNLPFVRLALDVGLARVVRTAEALGIESPLAPVPSMAIGSQEVSAMELAVAYGTLAAGGMRPTPRLLEGVRSRDGRWLDRRRPERLPGIDPRVALVVTHLLEGVIDRGTARSVRAAGLTLPLAGKTGTSNGGRDSWMVGYSTDLVVVAWVGLDSGEALGLSSTQAAVPLWTRFLRRIEPLLAGDPFPRPRGLPGMFMDGNEQPARSPSRATLRQEDRERRRAESAAMRAIEGG